MSAHIKSRHSSQLNQELSQPSMKILSVTKLNEESKNLLCKIITLMISAGNRPANLVNDPYFLLYTKTIVEFTLKFGRFSVTDAICHPKTISRYTSTLKSQGENELKGMLKGSPAYGLTYDHWTSSIVKLNILCVTYTFIDNNEIKTTLQSFGFYTCREQDKSSYEIHR